MKPKLKLLPSFLISCVLFLISCGYTKKDYDVIYDKDGYVLLKSKKASSESVVAQKAAFVSSEITPQDAAHYVKYYNVTPKDQISHPAFSDFSYSNVFALLADVKQNVGAGFNPDKAGLRVYFAAYDKDPVRYGEVLPFQNWMTNIIVGVYDDIDNGKYYNLSDLCPPNCFNKKDPTLKPDPTKSKLCQ